MSIALERPPAGGPAYRTGTDATPSQAPSGTGSGLADHLDVLPDPSFLIDGGGRIRLANRAAQKLARGGRDIAPGAAFCALWDAGARPVAQATLGIAAHETGRFDAQLDGSAAAFDVALSPTGEDGTVLAVCRDVTGLAVVQPAPPPAPAPEAPAPAPVSAPASDAMEQAQAIPDAVFHEIDHRLRNLFAMVPSLVKLSMRKGGNVNAVHKAITGRVAALARANSLSLQQAGLATGVSLDDLISAVLDRAREDDRIVSSGPPVRLATRAYNAVALTVHELATNALAHGALASPDGRLRIAWAVEEESRSGPLPEGATNCLRLLWTETGGAPLSGRPETRGFGTSTVDKLIASQHGTIEREWRRHGLNVTIDLPLYDLGTEPKYARPMQPPPLPRANGPAAGGTNGATDAPLPEHAAPVSASAREEAALEAEIVDQLDRIIAGTRH